MTRFEETFENFGKALGKLKEAYADEYGCNSSYLSVNIDDNNCVTIIPTNETGKYIETFREYVNT